LTRILEILGEAELRLRDAASKKILLEVALLNAIESRSAVSIDTVLGKLLDLKRSSEPEPAGNSGAPAPRAAAAPSAPPAPPPAPVSAAAAAPVAPPPVAPLQMMESSGRSDSADHESVWTSLVVAVGKVSPFTRTYLLEAHLVSLTPSLLVIGFPAEHADHIGLVDNARNQSLLQSKMAELGYPGLQIKFQKSTRVVAAPAAPVAPTSQPKPPVAAPPQKAAEPKPAAAAPPASPKAGPQVLNKQDFINDPEIKKALDAFKGQIVRAER
jgi:hypothetical protein